MQYARTSLRSLIVDGAYAIRPYIAAIADRSSFVVSRSLFVVGRWSFVVHCSSLVVGRWSQAHALRFTHPALIVSNGAQPPMDAASQVSLVCTVRDEADNIAALLESMLAQTRPAGEIVVNDC